MKFSINREQVLKPLQQVAAVVEKRQTLPVLSNVLVEVSDGWLALTGTDLELELVARLPLEGKTRAARLRSQLANWLILSRVCRRRRRFVLRWMANECW